MNEELNVQEPVTNVTENTEAQPVEQVEEGIELTDTTSNEEKKEVKTYTEEDFEKEVNERVNKLLPFKIERERRKLEKEYSNKLSKYEETENILTTGLETKDITEINKRLRNFYEDRGYEIPRTEKPRYSEDDEKALGEFDANKVIELGFDEMQEEANRLAEIGTDKMSPREKAMFNKLATELTYEKNKRELNSLGVKDDVLNNFEFKEFARQFNSSTPIKTVYDIYTKTYQPKPKVEPIGSMKSIQTTNSEVKDYYTPEEASKFTRKDYDNNPKLLEAVEKSMPLWYKK